MCQRLRCDAHLSPRSESRVGRTTATLYILFSCLYQYICIAIKAGYVQSSTGRHSSLKGMPPNNRLKERAPPHRTRRWMPYIHNSPERHTTMCAYCQSAVPTMILSSHAMGLKEALHRDRRSPGVKAGQLRGASLCGQVPLPAGISGPIMLSTDRMRSSRELQELSIAPNVPIASSMIHARGAGLGDAA